MKPVFISIASMALLASATPIISDTSSSLQVRGNDESDIVLEKRAMAAMDRWAEIICEMVFSN